MTARLLIIVSALLFTCHELACAQGAWLRAQWGYGSIHVFCDTCRSDTRAHGQDVLFGVGGTRSPRLQLGAVLEVWEHWLPDGQTLRAITMGTATLYYYPSVRSGLSLEGGIGLSDYRVLKGLHEGLLFENADTTYVSGTGVGITLGLGYDVRVSRLLWISPRVAYAQGVSNALHTPRGVRVARGWQQNVLTAGVGILME